MAACNMRKASVCHAVVAVFLQFFSWGLITAPMIHILNTTFKVSTKYRLHTNYRLGQMEQLYCIQYSFYFRTKLFSWMEWWWELKGSSVSYQLLLLELYLMSLGERCFYWLRHCSHVCPYHFSRWSHSSTSNHVTSFSFYRLIQRCILSPWH